MSLVFHLKNHTHIFFDGDRVEYDRGFVVISQGDFARRFLFDNLQSISGTTKDFDTYVDSEDWDR